MNARRCFYLAVLALVASPTFAQDTDLGAEDPFFAAREVASQEVLPNLIELADWCHDVKLYRERDRTWAAVLFLDPEDRRARRALRYRRSGEGWFQSKGYKEPRNRNGERFAELYERRRLALAPYRSLVLERARAESTSHGEREALLHDLVQLDREDHVIRGLLGEVRANERPDAPWILRESMATAEMRRLLPHFAKSSVDAAPMTLTSTPDEVESKTPLRWAGTERTARVRVLSTAAQPEASRTARFSHAVGEYFKSIFYRSQSHRDGLTIYLLTSPAELDAILDVAPETSQDARGLLQRAAGGWLSNHQLGQWSPNPARRLDGATRQTLGTLLMDAFGIDGRHGWAWEGIGLYLTYHMTGTRLTHFFKGGTYKQVRQTTLWTRLQLPETDWMLEGRRLIASERAPRLVSLIGKNVNSMKDEDLLYSYVLAAYLLEGRAKELPALLEAAGSGMHPVEAFESVLGASVPQIEARLKRWLRETAGS